MWYCGCVGFWIGVEVGGVVGYWFLCCCFGVLGGYIIVGKNGVFVVVGDYFGFFYDGGVWCNGGVYFVVLVLCGGGGIVLVVVF